MGNLISCPTCNALLSSEAANCPRCGQPITEEIKTKAIDEQNKAKEKKKKKRGIGCLIILMILIISGVYGYFFSPDTYFPFSEDEFINKFTTRINQPSIVGEFGKINLTREKTDDKKISAYNLNNDAQLKIIYSNRRKTDDIWKICINYDDERNYNENVILGSFLAAYLSFTDLGDTDIFGFREPLQYVRREVMSKPRNKRFSADNRFYQTSRKINGKEVPVMTLEIKPAFRYICFEAEEGAPQKK